MTLTHQQRRAQFRGVPFMVVSHSVSVGRRLADHQFPQRDLGYYEDLGRQDRSFTLEAYLVGEDVADQRDRLIAALETPGPGELIHPWLGRLWVVARPVEVSESRTERRKVDVKLSFVEAEEGSASTGTLTVTPVPRDLRRLAAAGVREAGLARITGLSLRGAPGFIRDRAGGHLDTITGSLALLRQQLPLSGQERFVADQTIRTLGQGRERFLSQPSGLGLLVVSGLAGMLAPALGLEPARGRRVEPARLPPEQAMSLMTRLGGLLGGREALPASPRWQGDAGAADDSLLGGAGLLMLSAAGEWVLPGLMESAPSRDHALSRLDPWMDWSERERQAAAAGRDDRSWRAIGQMQLASRAGALERPGHLRQAGFAAATPSLVAAHRLFGDARLAEALSDGFADPWSVAHPGFLSGQGAVPVGTFQE